MRSQALERASRRIVWVRFAGLAVVLLLAGRAAHLTVAHTRARTLGDRQIVTEQRLSPSRGTLFDRDGRELAITTEAASIFALPQLVENQAETAAALSEALDLELSHVLRRLSAHDEFTYIARWVEPDQAKRVRALDLTGVGIDKEARRSYPANELAAPVLGFANIDGKGVRGIEQLENDFLMGRPRRVRVERDARGRALALHSTNPRDVQGGDVALTLDSVMQGAAEAALADAITQHDAAGGFILTMDPKNGDILSLAEAPGFDPNQFRTFDFHETRSRTFTDMVEAGSTMKAFLVASALDARLIEADQLIDTENGSLRVRGKTIKDRRPFGVLTPMDVLRVSSNVGAVHIARAMGREAQHQGLVRFGFGTRSRSRFPVESTGLLNDWRTWQPVDQAAISYGQGLSVTGIQLGSALAALANDGMRMEPRLVLARRRPGAAWKTTDVRTHGRSVSARAARQTLDMMRTVVSSTGTGRLAGLKGVPVAGKTGTAQKFDRELGAYSQDKYMAWFIGVVPADDPALAIVVALDEPAGRLHSGGGVAAPLFARVAAAQLARRGIVTEPEPIPKQSLPVLVVERDTKPTIPSVATLPPQQAQGLLALVPSAPSRAERAHTPPRQTARIQTEPPSAAVAAPPARPAAYQAAGQSLSKEIERDPAFVPDFQGSTLALARRIAEHESLDLRTRGAKEGRVVSQSPVPGTVLSGDDRTVRLRFESRQTSARRRKEG